MDYPIVFVPGLFGSLGEDVIKSTGDFSFGFAEKIYRPFIDMLNSMGYVEGTNLFISYYDWKKSVIEAVDKYLFKDIEKVKEKTKKDKVIIIGHSLGGLLGRAYMNYFNPSSVDKLIMIGTPNLGAVNAYYFWSGGKLPYPKIEDNILYDSIKLGFILYYYLFKKLNQIEALRSIFPVVRDLLPSYEYGNYLFYKEKGRRKEIPIENMSINNEFLNTLEAKQIDENKLFVISGKGFSTNQEILVKIKNKEDIMWQDGKPIRKYKTNHGDGTVTTFSTLGNLGGENIVIEGNHTDILHKSQKYLSRILDRPLVKEIKEEKIEKVYIILAKDCHKVNIKTTNVNEISTNGMNIVDNRIQAIDLGGDSFWIIVAGDKDLTVKFNVESMGKSNPIINKQSFGKCELFTVF